MDLVASVWAVWMVETEGTKLPTPLAVMSNQSFSEVPGTEFFDAETGAENAPLRLPEIRRSLQRLAHVCKAPILAGLARQNRTEFGPYDWMVELIAIEP